MLTLVALFANQARLRGAVGTAGFLIAIAGFLLIRTGARAELPGGYHTAASAVSVGLALMGAALLLGGPWSNAVAAAWIAALAVGIAGAVLASPLAFMAAGVLVALGFAFTAPLLWRSGAP